MSTLRATDIPAQLVLAPTRGGEPFDLEGFTASLDITGPDGLPIDTDAATVTLDGDHVKIVPPTDASLFPVSGIYVFNVRLTKAFSTGQLFPGETLYPSETLLIGAPESFSSLGADPILLPVEDSNGWHDLRSARADWKDAPRDDVQLFTLLRVAMQACLVYAPPVTSVPLNYRAAQLMQARNIWNAGKVSPSGDLGGDDFVIRPHPLDWQVKQLLRPKSAVPVVA